MFEQLLKSHRIFVNNENHHIEKYRKIEANAKVASLTDLVHIYYFELDKNGEVQSNIDYWMYKDFSFCEVDNGFEVKFQDEENVRVANLLSEEDCIQFILAESKNN